MWELNKTIFDCWIHRLFSRIFNTCGFVVNYHIFFLKYFFLFQVAAANFSLKRDPFESTYDDFMEIWLQVNGIFYRCIHICCQTINTFLILMSSKEWKVWIWTFNNQIKHWLPDLDSFINDVTQLYQYEGKYNVL